jgi:GNAT superfamily N-acetyltransferase
MEFSPVQCTPERFSQYSALFAACFPQSNKFSPIYLDWLYAQNPDGPVVGFDAWEGSTLAAHYVCVPAAVTIAGESVLSLLSLNTATHPQFQGKGLFSKLAQLTYDDGKARGFDCIYGVANANSTPGFVRKLGFQLVRPLDVRVGIGFLGQTNDPPSGNIDFARRWTDKSLRWRCANPANPVALRQRGSMAQFQTTALLGGRCNVAATLHHVSGQESHGRFSALRLFMGIVPPDEQRFALDLSIPMRFRPSPLNLIYRSLSGKLASLNPNRVRFTFLDFDAY